MYRSYRIARILCLLLGISLTSPASAQDVRADAPQFSPGDWFLVHESGEPFRQTSIAIDAEGMRVQNDPGGAIDVYDAELNVIRAELETRTFYYEPSAMKYSFPLYVGKSWAGDFSVRSERPDGSVALAYRTTYACEVSCIERVEVPAGAFQAFKTVCERVDSDDGYRERHFYWFAPEAGRSVRQIWEVYVEGTGWVFDRDQVLVEYSYSYPVEFDVLPDGVESTCNAVISMNDTSALVQD